ncbi:hypothetical protein [Pseudothioclava nitratireducens]|jgi:hypothetical protein|nr:hypothetical protein [Defluviimonas nitratireducens]MDF1620564.1 hypothetical protein [Defluviimonas nitratireducens]
MGRILKAIAILVILGAIGVAGYAYLGDMAPRTEEQRIEITLPGGTSGS